MIHPKRITEAQDKHDEALQVLNTALEEELLVIEAYDKAAEKVADEPFLGTLRDFQREHQKAADKLGALVKNRGGAPIEKPGIRNVGRKVAMSFATLLTDIHTLTELKEIEERGLEELESFGNREKLDSESKRLFQTLAASRRAKIKHLIDIMQR